MVRDAYQECRILSADPVELICILYEHALDRVSDARSALAANDIVTRSRAISKALAAISELHGSLDHERGGEISRNLEKLYQYMRQRLTAANFEQKDEPLAEVETLLQTLAEGWKSSHQRVEEHTSECSETEPARESWSSPFAHPVNAPQLSHGWCA